MRHGMLLALASTLAFPAHAASINPGPSATDYMFQCGATFIIKAYTLKGEAKPTKAQQQQAVQYTEKFNDLAAKAEASFVKFNRTAKDARNYMQQHVDEMNVIFAQDPATARRFLRLCDARFPD